MLKIEDGLRWISSLGGPLILMERAALPSWSGDLASETHPWMDRVSDYDRAGEIEDYVGILNVDHHKALVLSMPDQTSYVSVNPRAFLLIRWIGADSEEMVLNTLRELDLDQPWIDTNAQIHFESGELALFDSVYAGSEITDSLNIRTDPGDYNISILSYRPTAQIDLLLILMRKTL